MRPVLFTLGDYTIYAYPVAMSLALLVSILLIARFAKREGYSYELFLEGVMISAATGLLGARFVFVMQHLDFFLNNIERIFVLRFTSLSVHGAILFSLVAALLWCRWRKVKFLEMADLMIPYYMVGYIIVRTGGCFMAGCCYGKVTEVPWGVVMVTRDFLIRHPVQLYAALGGIGMFIILKKFYRIRPFDGSNLLLFFILYGTLRFITEFFREEPVYWMGFSLAQVASLLIIILFLSVFLTVVYIRRSSSSSSYDD